MNDTYSAYLQSQAWEAKRKQRMGLSGFACEACGTKSSLQVHHLTYERIFQEDMADLMTLCRIHHEAAEEMVKKGVVKRFGCVSELRKATLFFVAPKSKVEKINYQPSRSTKARRFKKPSKAKRRAEQKQNLEAMIVNLPIQYRHLTETSSKSEVKAVLDADPAFRALLEFQRDKFRKEARKMFGRCIPRGRILSVAGQLYDKYTEALGVPTGHGDGSRYLPHKIMREHGLRY